MVLTIDDLPFVGYGLELPEIREKTGALLAALRSHRVPALCFVTGRTVEVPGEERERAALLRHWTEAGMELGNHGFAHLDLNRTPLDEYTADFLKGDALLRRVPGTAALRFFRHPMTHTGPSPEVKSAFDRFLEDRGYRVAPFTIEAGDYIYASLYADSGRAGDRDLRERLARACLDHLDRAVAFCEDVSRELFGREIPQILLLHANELNADLMDELLTRLEARGYRFAALADALDDPAYSTADGYTGAQGPSWLHRWSLTLRGRWRLEEEPDPPEWVLDLFRKR